MPDDPVAELTVGDPPPSQVDRDTAAAAALDGDELFAAEVEAPHVEEATIRRLLRGVGGAANAVIGDDDVPDHWRFTAQELDELTPPLTAYVNRRPRLRKLVAHGDEAAIGLVLYQYAERNIDAGRRARKARKELEHGDAYFDGEAGAGGGGVAAPDGRQGQGAGVPGANGLGLGSW